MHNIEDQVTACFCAIPAKIHGVFPKLIRRIHLSSIKFDEL